MDDTHVDVFGSTINYAARLVSQIGGGEVCISGDLKNTFMEEKDHWKANPEFAPEETGKSHMEYLKDIGTLSDRIRFETYGKFSFKGFEGEQEVFSIKLN